ncbi:MAG: winged helix-turn-helix domain-containing protein [Acidobacteriota bacterium]|nr:winged helix-turn-helix domain-containing protein [Acidobacteriota bacterium]MDQ5835887.1 winged helix-turn-helix domain-containing protein [Acidobacteriota bacterium]
MPDENLLATLEQGLRHSRATRSRLAARLADLEAEAERVRTELNEMDAIISQTEAAMFRILSSSFSAQAGHASDAEIEYALRRDSVVSASRPVQPQSHASYAPPPPAPPQDYIFRHQVPPIRADVEQKSDRFFERTIPQATAVLLRESGGPLHVNEIYNRLLEGGFQFTGHNPTISIAVSLNRNRRFRKVAPGTFDLVIRDAAQAS